MDNSRYPRKGPGGPAIGGPGPSGAGLLAEVCVVAAAYAALTIALGPISYGPVQFRVAEAMKSLVVWRPHLIAAFVAGNFLGNITSPQIGPWELAFMPLANLIGGSLCVLLARRLRSPWAGSAVYAVVVAVAVGLMLSAVLNLPFAALLPPLLLSEVVLIVGGVPIMRRVHLAVEDLRRGARPSR